MSAWRLGRLLDVGRSRLTHQGALPRTARLPVRALRGDARLKRDGKNGERVLPIWVVLPVNAVPSRCYVGGKNPIPIMDGCCLCRGVGC